MCNAATNRWREPIKFRVQWMGVSDYTQGNLFEIILNQTEISLYLPFSD